ncbi:Multiple drug resistance-associated protein-like transporter 1 [Bienertia sinuspersici]
MAPFGKKATYIAPGKIGSTRGQGFKAPFLPGVFSKENHSASNDVPHMSNANDGSINKAPRKEVNPLHTSLIESLNEDVHEDDMLQRSINNDALSRFIDQSASEGDLSMHEEETTDEIVDVEKDYPSLSTFEVVEKSFGDQDRGSVVCFGSGVRPKDVRGPLPSRFELTTRLHEKEKEKENDDLKK